MNNYYTQIPLHLDMLDVSKFELTPGRKFLRTEATSGNSWVSGQTPAYYSNINNAEYTKYLNNIFKELRPRDVHYCQFSGSSPHVDHDNSKCAINHYYVTQNASTIFHEAKPGAVPFFGVNETTANYYKPEDIIEVDRFLAQPSSLWLLNITKIHSLEFPGKYGPLRGFIKWRFDISYEDVYDRLFNEVIPKLNR